MREIRQSGSEGGASQSNVMSLPLSSCGAFRERIKVKETVEMRIAEA